MPQTFTLRLKEPTYEKIKEIAEKQERSINSQIEFAIKMYIEEYEKINGSNKKM